MKRLLIALAVLLGTVLPASAQLTTMPIPLEQWSDNNGVPLSAGGLCVFRAATSTLATTYTTAAGTVANANPILFNSAGRATTGGVFLTPGTSYKFVLVDFIGIAVPSCSAINGSTIWTVDNIEAVPGSAASVDVSVTAGESITAGEAVFLSNGAGGLNAGQWYRTDADLTYKSTSATMVGIAPNAITSGATGSVRISGEVTLAGPLTVGVPYYAGATTGAIVATPPTNAIRLGTSQSATVLIIGYTAAPSGPRGPPCGRLTLTTGVPVTTADVTAATTLYYAPYGGCNQLDLFNGTSWASYAFAQISIAVPATTSQMYDVWAYDNAGVVALEVLAWTNDTTRATALTTQESVYVKTGALTRRYLGSFRTTTVSGQTEDSAVKRFVWNYYNRVRRPMQRIDTTASWTYGGTTVRQANAAVANQLAVVVGVAETMVDVHLIVTASNDTLARGTWAGIGVNSTTTYSGTLGHFTAPVVNYAEIISAHLTHMPAVGYTFYSWNESNDGAGTATYYGEDASANNRKESGLSGWVEG